MKTRPKSMADFTFKFHTAKIARQQVGRNADRYQRGSFERQPGRVASRFSGVPSSE